MKWVIKDKKTGNESYPVGIEWFLFGEEDLRFPDGETIPLDDFKHFYNAYEIIPVIESPATEGWVSVEIEFGSHLRCMLSFSGDELKIDGAVNGWGNPVTADEIKITKLPKPPKQ